MSLSDGGLVAIIPFNGDNAPRRAFDCALVFRVALPKTLSNLAWSLAVSNPVGNVHRPSADTAHQRIEFGYQYARADRTGSEGHEITSRCLSRFAHLAVTLSRCMNIPARYCTGYLGDIGVPVDPNPMDLAAGTKCSLTAAGSPWTPATITRASDAS